MLLKKCEKQFKTQILFFKTKLAKPLDLFGK